MILEYLIWDTMLSLIAFYSLESCPTLIGMSDHRKNFFRWLLSVLLCCWNNSSNSYSENSRDNHGMYQIESIEMGPMTLRDYVNTLQPYDPEIHGWRGEEPWKYRSNCAQSVVNTNQVVTNFQSSFQPNCYSNVNHIHIDRTQITAQ